MSLKAIHIIVHGLVQGVGFRFYVRDRSAQYGIKGSVKNLHDGTVEIYAEGDEKQLHKFIEKIREGPSFGHVSRLVRKWKEPSDSYTDFTILF